MVLLHPESQEDIIAHDRRYAAIGAEFTRLSAEKGMSLDELLTFSGTVFTGIWLIIMFLTVRSEIPYILGGLCVFFIGLCILSIKSIFYIRRRRRAYTDYLATDDYQGYLRYQESRERFSAEALESLRNDMDELNRLDGNLRMHVRDMDTML